MKMVMATMTIAKMVSTPIFSSDQASERVRGILKILEAFSFQLSASFQKRPNIRIGRGAQRVGAALEDDQAVAHHDELRLARLRRRRRHDLDLAVRPVH